MLPFVVAVLCAGDGMPGLNADKPGCTGLAPDEGIREGGNITNHTSSGALFIDTQGLGGKANHAVAVVGEKILIDGNGVGVVGQIIGVALEKSRRHTVQTQGRLGGVKTEFIIGGGVLVIKGDGETGVIANAKGDGLLVCV